MCIRDRCLGLKIAEQLEFTPKDDRVDTLQCVLLRPGACVPSKGTPLSAGYDLYSVESLEVPPHGQAVVSIGLALEIKPGWYGRIAPRSGLALSGLSVGAGVIDPDYQGEIKVVLFNHSPKSFLILKRMRVAQLLIERVANPRIEEMKAFTRKTARGRKGFGSTGISVLEELRMVQNVAEEAEEWADVSHKPRTSPRQVKSVAKRAAEGLDSSGAQAAASGVPAPLPKPQAITRELAEESGKATWASDAFR